MEMPVPALPEPPVVNAWAHAALLLGEHLAAHRPDGYYQFTAQEWLTWAVATVPGARERGGAEPKESIL